MKKKEFDQNWLVIWVFEQKCIFKRHNIWGLNAAWSCIATFFIQKEEIVNLFDPIPDPRTDHVLRTARILHREPISSTHPPCNIPGLKAKTPFQVVANAEKRHYTHRHEHDKDDT